MKMKPFQSSRGPGNALYFLNGKYQVIITKAKDAEGVDYLGLSFRREDRKPIFDWRDIQVMKNELLGPEAEMVQLFPAESRLVDTSNQYYAFHYPGKTWPFGFEGRAVTEKVQVVNPDTGQHSQQRPFSEEHRPADLEQHEEMARALIRDLGLRMVEK
jgi:hypothetical protein